ncbi:sigma-70 family RNA polymerase sigma factor [Luteolibacter ambystomatis]|uniref:Sigma-70 family RNA polymerase sigma factor n=1 Tax=Luteolibacter ambystomatis TaxID=2824561 RepID=A0A975G8Q7_9BACT|nr:sigma-70 family RNA polymerase sigma factor [Luteolibacter ambystomatis]QUE50873.1 sigma-70 family RNA polymerase sigma factor [Luteolibacter ambystomatis]
MESTPTNASDPDDATLLGRWSRDCCERSFHLLVTKYAALVHQAARRLGVDDTIAEEAAQATFILLARKACTLADRHSLAGWLHVTAMHQSRNLKRRQIREYRKRHRYGNEFDGPSIPTWDDGQPELARAMAALRPGDREILLLRFYRALSVKEMAGVTGLSVEAAQKRLTRAVERLRLSLCERGGVSSSAALAA